MQISGFLGYSRGYYEPHKDGAIVLSIYGGHTSTAGDDARFGSRTTIKLPGGSSGTLITAGVLSSGVIYTTPATGHFVMTQVGQGIITIPGFPNLEATNGPLTFSPGPLVLPCALYDS